MNNLINDKNFDFLNDKDFDKKNEFVVELISILDFHKKGAFDESIRKSRIALEIFMKTVIWKYCFGNDDNKPNDIKTIFESIIKSEKITYDVRELLYKIRKESNAASHYNEREFNFIDSINVINSFWKILIFFVNKNVNKKFDFNLYLENFKDDEIKFNQIKLLGDVERDEIYKINESFKIDKISLKDWFEAKPKITIPLYQRKYTWNQSHVNVLLNDVFDKTNDNQEHYFGTIAGKVEKNTLGDKTVKLIDGQQRITTTLIVLCSIYDILISLNFKDSKLEEIIKNNDFENISLLDDDDQLKVFKNIINISGYSYEDKKNFIETNALNETKIWKNYQEIKERLTEKFKNNIEKYCLFVSTLLNKFCLTMISFDSQNMIIKKN